MKTVQNIDKVHILSINVLRNYNINVAMSLLSFYCICVYMRINGTINELYCCSAYIQCVMLLTLQVYELPTEITIIYQIVKKTLELLAISLKY
jgi:hypothetical protein